MGVEKPCDFSRLLRPEKLDLAVELKFRREFSQGGFFLARSDDGQVRMKPLLLQLRDRFNQQVNSFVGNESAEIDELSFAGNLGAHVKDIRRIRITHDGGRQREIASDRFA